MALKPDGAATLEHGERFGKLTVLRRTKLQRSGQNYRCGCVCGSKNTIASAEALMKGRVTQCKACDAKGGT